MSSTTIRYRNIEFVGNDLPIEVWMLQVACQMDADAGIAPWLEELREEWRLQALVLAHRLPSTSLSTQIADESDWRVTVAKR